MYVPVSLSSAVVWNEQRFGERELCRVVWSNCTHDVKLFIEIGDADAAS